MWTILAATLSVSVIIFGVISAYRYEKRKWNNGIAPDGTNWIHFDNDSQGGRGYKDLSGNCCWISYPGIDKQKGAPPCKT